MDEVSACQFQVHPNYFIMFAVSNIVSPPSEIKYDHLIDMRVYIKYAIALNMILNG